MINTLPNPLTRRNLSALLICALCLSGTGLVRAEFRTWTDRYGRSLEAEIVELGPQSVTIRDRDGETAQVPYNHFSDAHRALLQEQRQATQEEPQPEPDPEPAPEPESEPVEDRPGDGKSWEDEVAEVAHSLNRGAALAGLAEGRKLEEDTARRLREEESREIAPTDADESGPDQQDPLLAALTGLSAAEFARPPAGADPADQSRTDSPAPGAPRDEPAQAGDDDLPEKIPYTIVGGWELPNEIASSQRILISPTHATKEHLRVLAANLVEDFSDQSYADILVFTSKEAAEHERQYADVDFSEVEKVRQQYVARFTKDLARGILQMELFPGRPGADQILNLK